MTSGADSRLNELASTFPEGAKDAKLNLKTILSKTGLSPEQAWGTALACAYNEGNKDLISAILADGAEWLSKEVVADAQAVASLMSMNNVYYRFRHMIGKPEYQQMPARLRMTAMARPKTDRQSFELFSLAVSAINGCEQCITSHESVLVQHQVSQEHIHDAVRVAAVIRSAAVTLGFSN